MIARELCESAQHLNYCNLVATFARIILQEDRALCRTIVHILTRKNLMAKYQRNSLCLCQVLRFLFSLTMIWQCAVPALCMAEQFVLFDVTFDYTKEDADNSKPSKSHYYVKDKMLNADRPKDWTSPVDYRNGTVHVRLEVIDKPSGDEPTTWSICYIPNKGQKNGYGCLGTDIYKKTGVYEKDISMKSFWENDSIVWKEGIKQMDLVIKDNSGGSGHAHKRADAEKFFPTKVRLTLTQVSEGSKYDPKLTPTK